MKAHSPTLCAPFYGRDGHLALHRFFDDAFVPAFLDDLRNGRLGDPAGYAWLDTERMAFADHPTLRLPLHRTFHLVSCEVVCDTYGRPPFDGRRIRSAGFCVRRVPPKGSAQRWVVDRGLEVGWSKVEAGEPDLTRRVRRAMPRSVATIDPPYSGERTYPMHKVSAVDAGGRTHTILYGFLPLGGASDVRPSGSREAADADQRASAQAAIGQELPSPFGTGPADEMVPARNGIASRGFFRLVEVLVRRYRIGIDRSPANAHLEALLDGVSFVRRQFEVLEPEILVTVFEWLEQSTIADSEAVGGRRYSDQLIAWLAQEVDGPRAPLQMHDGRGRPLHADLEPTAEWFTALRLALVHRGLEHAGAMAAEIPVARYGQGEDDVYVAQAFVRYGDEDCEHTEFGVVSTVPFRVASPYTPEAIRPTLIEMPRFADVKRGLQAHLLAPDDLANKILSLRIKRPLEVSSGSEPTTGVCWLFSFSIPAITICAMVLLMVVISLLNIVFFWIPWVFAKTPFFCKRN